MIYINILLLICVSCTFFFHSTEPVKMYVCDIYMFLYVLNISRYSLETLLPNSCVDTLP